MKILCIDTSSDVCSVCVMQEDKLCALKELNNGKTHSENLMPLINEVVDNLDTIEAIACCVGPGSFTGIRIGVSVVKAIAEVKNIPVIGVTSLKSLSYNEETYESEIVSNETNRNKKYFTKIVCSLIDAKNNQVYAGIFNEHEKVCEYMADDIDNVLEAVETEVDKILEQVTNTEKNDKTQLYENVLFVGNGAILHKKKILQKFDKKAVFTNKNEQTSSSLGKCAYQKCKKSQFDSADTILPLYLRKSQAERMQEQKRNDEYGN